MFQKDAQRDGPIGGAGFDSRTGPMGSTPDDGTDAVTTEEQTDAGVDPFMAARRRMERRRSDDVQDEPDDDLEERVTELEERVDELETIVDAIDDVVDRPLISDVDEIVEGQKFEGVVVNCEPVVLDNGDDTLKLRTSALDVELGDGVRARSTVHGYETAVVEPDEIEMVTPADEEGDR